MSKNFKKGLYLFVIATITTMIALLTTFGASAAIGDRNKFTAYTTEGVTIEYKITSGAFNTVEIKSVDIPFELGYIELTIPETTINPENNIEYSVTSIGAYAFDGKPITAVTIPDSVEYIGDEAFYNCYWLENIYCESNVPPYIGYNVFENCPTNFTIHIPQNTRDTYVFSGWPEDKLVE